MRIIKDDTAAVMKTKSRFGVFAFFRLASATKSE